MPCVLMCTLRGSQMETDYHAVHTPESRFVATPDIDLQPELLLTSLNKA
jgi:hypothetical protein